MGAAGAVRCRWRHNVSTSNSSILFNLAGGGIILFVAGYMTLSYVYTPEIPLCSQRYTRGIQTSYVNATGHLLSPSALQSRSSGRHWGFSGNATAVPVKSQTFNNALEVKLASVDNDGDDEPPRNGVGFVWQPAELNKASSACLSYAVFIPDDFKFAENGYLPGLFGSQDLYDLDKFNADQTFATRVVWQQSGDVGVEVRAPDTTGFIEGAHRKTVWPKGQWVPVEQEVSLNKIGAADGHLRTWINGVLVVDRGGLSLRVKPQDSITGVVADIGYSRNTGPVGAVQISPFVVRWQ